MEMKGCCKSHNCTQEKVVILKLATNFLTAPNLKVRVQIAKQLFTCVTLNLNNSSVSNYPGAYKIAHSPPLVTISSLQFITLPSRC
jgi:hypothetical protein